MATIFNKDLSIWSFKTLEFMEEKSVLIRFTVMYHSLHHDPYLSQNPFIFLHYFFIGCGNASVHSVPNWRENGCVEKEICQN